jgi:hypothetical protein
VEARCIPLILQALPSIAIYEHAPVLAVLAVGRLCEVAGPGHFVGLVNAAVTSSLVNVFLAYNKDNNYDAEVRSACRAVMNKLLA